MSCYPFLDCGADRFQGMFDQGPTPADRFMSTMGGSIGAPR